MEIIDHTLTEGMIKIDILQIHTLETGVIAAILQDTAKMIQINTSLDMYRMTDTSHTTEKDQTLEIDMTVILDIDHITEIDRILETAMRTDLEKMILSMQETGQVAEIRTIIETIDTQALMTDEITLEMRPQTDIRATTPEVDHLVMTEIVILETPHSMDTKMRIEETDTEIILELGTLADLTTTRRTGSPTIDRKRIKIEGQEICTEIGTNLILEDHQGVFLETIHILGITIINPLERIVEVFLDPNLHPTGEIIHLREIISLQTLVLEAKNIDLELTTVLTDIIETNHKHTLCVFTKI